MNTATQLEAIDSTAKREAVNTILEEEMRLQGGNEMALRWRLSGILVPRTDATEAEAA